MSLGITIIGKEKLVARFESMPKRVHDRLYAAVTQLSLQLENYIKNNKLSGQVLNKISGRLQRSIHNDVTDNGQRITGRAFSAKPMPYAAIHEYGGVINAHVVEAINGKALRFMMNGRIVFAKRVQIPAIRMPERSYMRSSLADMRQRIFDQLKGAALEGVKE